MKLQDIENKLLKLKLQRKGIRSYTIPKLVEAVVEYTLVESPRVWYLLEIPEATTSSGGWKKIVEIMVRRGCRLNDQERFVTALAEAFVFNGSTKFRRIVSALMFKVSKDNGIVHHWLRVLYVSAKHILDSDLSDEFDPRWEEPLELDHSFSALKSPFRSVSFARQHEVHANSNNNNNNNSNGLSAFEDDLNSLLVMDNVEYQEQVESSRDFHSHHEHPLHNFILQTEADNDGVTHMEEVNSTAPDQEGEEEEDEHGNIEMFAHHPTEFIIHNDCFRTIEGNQGSNEIMTQIITDVETF